MDGGSDEVLIYVCAKCGLEREGWTRDIARGCPRCGSKDFKMRRTSEDKLAKTCPKCGKNMKKGYLKAGRDAAGVLDFAVDMEYGVWWYARKEPTEGIQAWRCPACNYLEFYVGS